MTAELPKLKKEDVLWCPDCEVLVTKKKALQEDDFFGTREYICPGCKKKLGDAPAESDK